MELEDAAEHYDESNHQHNTEANPEDAPVYLLVSIVKEETPCPTTDAQEHDSSKCSPFQCRYQVSLGDDGEMVVGASILYELNDIVHEMLSSGPLSNYTLKSNDDDCAASTSMTESEIISTISPMIWQLSLDELKHYVKRTYLQWHPLKNENDSKGSAFFSKVLYSYLLFVIACLDLIFLLFTVDYQDCAWSFFL